MSSNIPALTGVRGFAALWVVLMHYTWGAGQGGEGLFSRFTFNGFGGVIIFLVLSGFVMTHVYTKFRDKVTKESFADYFYKRIVRIYPLHLATLLAYVVLIQWGYVAASHNETSYTFILNALLIHAWGFVNEFSWNTLSWTISVELFAYFFFPFMVWTLFKLNKIFSIATVIGAVIYLMDAPHLVLLQALGIDTTGLILGHGHYLAQFTMVFLSGVALYRVVKDTVNGPVWISDALVVAGFSFLAYGCSLAYQPWLMIGAISLIAGLLRDKGLGRIIFGNRASVFLGDISYSLYLTHFLLSIVLPKHVVGLGLAEKVLSALVLATICYYLIEKPSRNYLRNLWMSQKKITTA